MAPIGPVSSPWSPPRSSAPPRLQGVLRPDRPDFIGIAQRERNQQSVVGAFASDFVVAWRTATVNQRDSLARFITLPEQGLALPSTPAAVITAPQVGPVLRMGTLDDTELYTAVISVNERPYASAQPTRTFYQVPVSLWNRQPRALDFRPRSTIPARARISRSTTAML